MEKHMNWKILTGIIMLFLASGFYVLHYFIFHDAHHIFIYLIGDIAFVFIEVLLVTLIIHHLLKDWEKKSHLKKLNMVIEVFFSEFGKTLLAYFSSFDKNLPQIQNFIIDQNDNCDLNFKQAFSAIKKYQAHIDMKAIDLPKLASFLQSKRNFIVSMLQNPALLEHQSFTETIMAIFHIAEELISRNIENLSEEDLEHTKEDIERAYNKLIAQWLSYMEYTKKHYPYFFLFAMSTNPFNNQSKWFENSMIEDPKK
jgi:hypothetical protein